MFDVIFNCKARVVVVFALIMLATPVLAVGQDYPAGVSEPNVERVSRQGCSGCSAATGGEPDRPRSGSETRFFSDDVDTRFSVGYGVATRVFLYRLSRKFNFAWGGTLAPGLNFTDGYSLTFMLSVGSMNPGKDSGEVTDRLWSESYLMAGRRIYEDGGLSISLTGGVGITRFSYHEKYDFSEQAYNIAMSGYRAGFDFIYLTSDSLTLQFYAAYTYLFNGRGYLNQGGLSGDDVAFGVTIRHFTSKPWTSCCATAMCL